MKRKISGNLVDVYINKVASLQPGAALPRFLIAVSVKVSKKSTQRNLIKRRLRNILRSLTMTDSGLTIKLSAKPNILSAKFSEIKTELEQLFKRI